MKRRLKDLTEKEIMVTLDSLYTAASSVRGRDAIKLFLRDLLTPSERVMLGRRIVIARLLISGSSYDEISKRMGVGHATIGRVQCWLNDQLPGYEKAIEGLERELAKRKEKKLYATSPMYRLKKKYPMHFLLFSTPRATIGKEEIYPHKKST